ncbi:MAG: cold shock domain-containing protein [Gammaproteobacteria bacterium]|nr:cold shock domain-containing protein [Gammaproteobacteria bacterium]MDH5729617.1 cold shock domain-containing protein [Gammaproteobacteria bacterium]
MRQGTVKWFNRHKGYGWIKPNDSSADVFVFYPSIQAEGFKVLQSGQAVSFETQPSAYGDTTTRVWLNEPNQ